MRLLFPSTLTARQRAALHRIADENGLEHGSSGDGTHRRITVGNADAESVKVKPLYNEACEMATCSRLMSDRSSWCASWQVCTADDRDAVSDEQICAALSEHLHLDAAAAFARPSKLAASKQATTQEQVLHAIGVGSDLRLHPHTPNMSNAQAHALSCLCRSPA
jgi:R3H domain